ncbi:DinB family protein [bacterium]|nr:DinB family protein [bacterium]MCI0603374.1 DinB family protein [bacterium]
MEKDELLRKQLRRLLDWEDAHVSFDKAIQGIPPDLQGVQPAGLPYSAWQILEHLRLCQYDILDFCRNPEYKERGFEDYWPNTIAPNAVDAWNKSIAAYRKDREDLTSLAIKPEIDLYAMIPWGTGQTILRELLLVADHNAYHVADLIAVRRLLGLWSS